MDALEDHGPLDSEVGDLVTLGKHTDPNSTSIGGLQADDTADPSGRMQSIHLDDGDIPLGGPLPDVEDDPLSPRKDNSQFVDEDLMGLNEANAPVSVGALPVSTQFSSAAVPMAVKTSSVGSFPAPSPATPADSLPSSTPLAGTQEASEPGIKVSIKEPEKVETVSSLGMKSHYVQYVVQTTSSLPGMIADGLEVKRRFSDFDALHKQLKHEYRGYFVPPLPQKSFIQAKMAQDDFIRLRRADLQAFIKSLITHPVIKGSEALKLFLLQPGELSRNPAWTYLINPPAAARQKAGSGGYYTSLEDSLSGGAGSSSSTAAAVSTTLKSGLGTWMNWMKASVAQLQPPKRELSEDEVQLRQAKELLVDLEKLLELAVDAARSMCAHQDDLCQDTKELGRTFAMLSKFEEAVQMKVGQYTAQGASAGARATDLNKLAYGSAKQHGVWKTLSIKTAASLVTLHDYWVLVPEAIHALDLREAALTHLHMLQDDLLVKQQQQQEANVAANKLRILSVSAPTPSPAEKRSYQLTTAISQLEEQIKSSQKEYEVLKQRNQAELSRLHLEREVDFRRMMALFVRTQADLIAASAEMWSSLAKQFDAE